MLISLLLHAFFLLLNFYNILYMNFMCLNISY